MHVPQSSRPSALLAGFLTIIAGCVLAAASGVPLIVVFGATLSAFLALHYWWDQPAQRLRALHRMHLCRHCDYDLTGNVSGVCPECGTPTGVAPRS